MQDNPIELFDNWLATKIKPNTAFISKKQYHDIVQILNNKEIPNDRALARRIKSNNFQIMSYGPVGIQDELYVPTKVVCILPS